MIGRIVDVLTKDSFMPVTVKHSTTFKANKQRLLTD